MHTPNEKLMKTQSLQGQYPDATGHFGFYGGRYAGETLMAALTDLEAA